ncbi:hypothetical protein AB0G74_08690 [Streptomyces sp. NPDC020875]|uniref:hypothetical protein n=1 Tax=Streptomyces sp. NPDC020875 TaxID=3154898 RepID=UPI0033CC3B55
MPAVHHTLPIPDHAALRKDAGKKVLEELGRLARTDERFRRVCEIVAQADLEIEAHVEERNQAAMSLWFYDGVRGLNRVLGISAGAYDEMRRLALVGDRLAPINRAGERMNAEELREAARRAGVEYVETAAETLPALAETVSVATGRRKAALPVLQDTALALMEEPYSMSTEQIGELGGVTAKYVRDSKNKAIKRRGY